jgi:p-aminobenzoyl-glutamate transporter AbgT
MAVWSVLLIVFLSFGLAVGPGAPLFIPTSGE